MPAFELQALCREHGLKVRGRKAELVARLLEAQGHQEVEEAEEEDRPAAEAVEETDLEDMTLVDLKAMCRERGLKVGGTKADIIQRLRDDDPEDDPEDEPDEQPRPASKHSSDYDDEDDHPSQTRADLLVEALENDELDENALESILDLNIPSVGDIKSGVVVSMTDWGAFIELDEGGWVGLLHVSEISNEFVDNIEDHVYPGQKVTVMVIRGKTNDKLSFSMRRVPQNRLVSTRDLRPDQRVAETTGDLPASGSTAPAMTPSGSMRVIRAGEVVGWEARLAAVESVLHQLGYSKALKAAREEVVAGTKKPLIPAVEQLIKGPTPQKPAGMQAKENKSSSAEQRDIDEVLRDLMSGGSAKSADAESDDHDLDLDVLMDTKGSGAPDSAGGWGLDPAEDADNGDLEADMADMLSDSFATSTYNSSPT